MRLSEAILIGREVVKPRPGTVYRVDDNSGCAIGMAVVGAGRKRIDGQMMWLEFFEMWPWVYTIVKCPCQCPLGLGYHEDVGSLIPHLFDQHVFGSCDWTIEQIAHWIATIEPSEHNPQPASAAQQAALLPEVPAYKVEDLLKPCDLTLPEPSKRKDHGSENEEITYLRVRQFFLRLMESYSAGVTETESPDDLVATCTNAAPWKGFVA